jgi:hypothetical protein
MWQSVTGKSLSSLHHASDLGEKMNIVHCLVQVGNVNVESTERHGRNGQ